MRILPVPVLVPLLVCSSFMTSYCHVRGGTTNCPLDCNLQLHHHRIPLSSFLSASFPTGSRFSCPIHSPALNFQFVFPPFRPVPPTIDSTKLLVRTSVSHVPHLSNASSHFLSTCFFQFFIYLFPQSSPTCNSFCILLGSNHSFPFIHPSKGFTSSST